MSDFREAFEEWFEDKFDPDKELTLEDKDMCREAWQAALQSQTAPAVPEPTPIVIDWEPCNPTCCGECNGYRDEHCVCEPAKASIARQKAAPQPDHSPYGGKKIGDQYDLGVALSRHFDGLRDSETGHIAFDPCDSNDIDEVLAIISAHLSPAPAADGWEVEPVGWPEINKLIQQYVSEYEYTDGEGGYYTPTDWHRYMIEDAIHGVLSEIPLRPATRPAPPRNEEIAADFEAWLSQVRYMEGLSAHDIIESAEDYITLLRSNGGAV